MVLTPMRDQTSGEIIYLRLRESRILAFVYREHARTAYTQEIKYRPRTSFFKSTVFASGHCIASA